MILVVKGADFSANKIETIDIPMELSDWTLNVISKYPSFQFTDAVKKRLELFYRTMVENNILNKLQYFALPIFANSINEAVANVLSDTYTPTVPNDASSVYTQTMGYGLARTGAVSAVTSLISLPSESASIMNLKDLHIMAFPVDEVENGNSYAATCDVFSDLKSSQFVSYLNTFGIGNVLYTWSQCYVPEAATSIIGPAAFGGANTSLVTLDINMKTGAYPMLISNNGSTFSASINSQDYVNKPSAGGYVTGSTYASLAPICFGLSPIVVDNQWSARRFGILSLGKYLTNEESKIYQNALIALLNL